MRQVLINVAAFQLCWFAAVMGAAAGVPLLGPAFAAIWLPLHVVTTKSSAPVELKLLVTAGLLGYALDSALVFGGWLSFPAQAQFGAPSTLWMVTLWLGFAATLRHALGWLRGRYAVAALLGAVCGPLAYWGGSRLGAIVLSESNASLLAVSVEWLVAMPLLLLALAYFERSHSPGNGVDASAAARQES